MSENVQHCDMRLRVCVSVLLLSMCLSLSLSGFDILSVSPQFLTMLLRQFLVGISWFFCDLYAAFLTLWSVEYDIGVTTNRRAIWKILNGDISASDQPIDFMFHFRVGFLELADHGWLWYRRVTCAYDIPQRYLCNSQVNVHEAAGPRGRAVVLVVYIR